MEPTRTPQDIERDSRERLRDAVRNIPVDARLHSKVRKSLRNPEFRLWVHVRWSCIVVAVCLAIAVAPKILLRLESAKVEAILKSAPPNLRLGLGDHLECALELGQRPVPRRAVQGQAELRGVVETSLGIGMQIVDIHQCVYLGQQLIHVMAAGSAGKLSILLASKAKPGKIQQGRISEFSVSSIDDQLYLVSTRDLTEDQVAIQDLVRGLQRINWEALTARRFPGSGDDPGAMRVLDLRAAK